LSNEQRSRCVGSGAPVEHRKNAKGVDFNQVLVRFALERMLYRLSQSAHAGHFVHLPLLSPLSRKREREHANGD
jgi:hypothetical protein